MSSAYSAYPVYAKSGAEWLGPVPDGWLTLDAKRLFRNRREPSLVSDEQLAASQKYGVVPQQLMMKLNDSKVMLALKGTAGFRHVESGDFVISLRSFEGGIEHSTYSGCVSPAYTVLQSRAEIVSRYFASLFKSAPFIAALQSTTDSLRDGKSISYSQFGSLILPLPPLPEQKQIARFLDYETSRIDALIEKQERLIELLQEKRQAVISYAVTKGLNPDAPMKDSGIEWLGEVPAHWEISQLKYIINPESSITYGIVQAGPHVETGVPYIKTSDMSGDSLPLTGYSRTSLKIDESYSRARVRPGDLVISIRASVGKCLPVPDGFTHLNLTQGTAKISPADSIHRDFLLGYISSLGVQEYLHSRSKGATFKEITLEMLRRLIVLVPSYQEQEAISEYVRLNLEAFAKLESASQNLQALLQERRTALISAAVTGKIDVRSWTPPDAPPSSDPSPQDPPSSQKLSADPQHAGGKL